MIHASCLMSRFPRLFAGLGLAFLAAWLLLQLREWEADGGADPSKVIGLFLGFLGTALVGGVLLAMTILPMIGELLGNTIYGSTESLGPDPHRTAIACLARGEFRCAQAAYEKIIADHPDDALAVTELCRLHLDRLEDPASAIRTLERALEREWPPDEAGGFAIQLGDLYAAQGHDPERARLIYEQVLESMPGSRHAANAATRLRGFPSSSL